MWLATGAWDNLRVEIGLALSSVSFVFHPWRPFFPGHSLEKSHSEALSNWAPGWRGLSRRATLSVNSGEES